MPKVRKLEVCDRAREIIDDLVLNRKREIASLLRLCESPIEQILTVAFCERFHPRFDPGTRTALCDFGAVHPLYEGIFELFLKPQFTISTFRETYRADFYVSLTRRWYGHSRKPGAEHPLPEWGRTVVEVDGHEFHDRTKEQARSDRRRDRDMIFEGFTVLRYTGSEVYDDRHKIVEEIELHLDDIASEVYFSYRDKDQIQELLEGPLR